MMDKKKPGRLHPGDLRRRAEELLREQPADLSSIPPEEAGRLLHELQVHQVELEMQNNELRRAQMEIEESRAKYFDLYSLAPVGYFTVSEKGSILEANLRGADQLGVGRNRLLHQLLTRYIVPEDQDVYYLHRKSVLETGARQVCELRMYSRDSSPFWARLETVASREGEDGSSVFRIAVSDITEQKRAEELRSSEERYRAVTQTATDAIFSADSEGNIVGWNRGAETIFGYSDAEVIGQPATLLMPSRYRDGYLAGIMGMLSGGERYFRGNIAEMEGVRKDGTVFPLEISLAAWQVTDGQYYTAIIRDVTDRKRAEEEKRDLERQVQQMQRLESMGVLAGGIAHDFNNLLMVVLGNAELALQGIPPMSPARWNLTEITIATERAAALCRHMLTYAGKSVLTMERVGLRDLVEEMTHLLKTVITKKASLNLNLERELPPIQGDPSQIRQIVMNLIINASEAIGDRSGEITVSVGTTRCDEEYLRKTELRKALAPGLYVHIEVTDTGHGMDEETRSRIFEPFFSTKFTGRGLGLAAVLGIVRAHRGTVKVHSEPGKGTTFKILFPALAYGEDSGQPLEASPPANWRGTGTILLVEDEESLIVLGARMLENLGFSVLTATDGLQAVDLYRERGKEIVLVLLDLAMPQMDGLEAIDELRRLNTDVQVVLASGYSEEEVSSRFAEKKLSGVLQKPYTLAKLRDLLAGLLQKRPGGGE